MHAPRTEQEFIDYFWAKVDKNGPIQSHVPELGPCWLWIGGTDKDGYGRIYWKKANLRTHRVSWMLSHGDIPEGLFILHRCDNPPCVNDSHLFSGTHVDNCQDSLKKGRSYIGDKNPLYGKHHTEEAKRKIGDVHRGKPCSPEMAQMLRTMNIGKKRSPESRLRYSAANKRRWAEGVYDKLRGG